MKSLLFLFLFKTALVWTKPRLGVVKYGTTVPPGYTRKEETKAVYCPESHPVALGNYQFCCSEFQGSSGCPEQNITQYSPTSCCDGSLIPCPGEHKCKTTTRPGSWSLWTAWTPCSAPTCEASEGSSHRVRACISPAPFPPDNPNLACPGNAAETVTCTDHDISTCSDCGQRDTDFPGGDIAGPLYASDSAGCQDLCKSNPACFYFTFNTYYKDCWLKAPAMVTDADKVSASDVHCLQTDCYAVHKDIVGQDINVINNVASELDCAAHCSSNTLCKAFVWSNPSFTGNGGPNVCYLKGGTGLYSVDLQNLHSGFMDCTCFQDTVNYHEAIHDVPGQNWGGISHPLICLLKCIQEPQCDYFVYSKGINHCWLKNWRMTMAPKQGDISGTRGCKLEL